jgi:hypothetical protein
VLVPDGVAEVVPELVVHGDGLDVGGEELEQDVAAFGVVDPDAALLQQFPG